MSPLIPNWLVSAGVRGCTARPSLPVSPSPLSGEPPEFPRLIGASVCRSLQSFRWASSAVISGASFSLTNPYIAAAKMSSVTIAFTVTTSNDKFRPVEELAACLQPRVTWLQQRERKWLVLPKSPAKLARIFGAFRCRVPRVSVARARYGRAR